MEWAWQSSDYDCTAAFELNKRQLLALCIRSSNDGLRANAPRLPTSGQTHNATFSGAFATPNFRHLFISTKRRLAAADASSEGLKLGQSRRSSRPCHPAASTRKRSDLLVLDRDPLADIRNTRSLRSVMQNGRLYDAATLDEQWPRRTPRASNWFEETPKQEVAAAIAKAAALQETQGSAASFEY